MVIWGLLIVWLVDLQGLHNHLRLRAAAPHSTTGHFATTTRHGAAGVDQAALQPRDAGLETVKTIALRRNIWIN